MEFNGQFNAHQLNAVIDRFLKKMDIALHAHSIRDQVTLIHSREPRASAINATTGKFSLRLVLVPPAQNGRERKTTDREIKCVDQTFAMQGNNFLLPVYAELVLIIPEPMAIGRRTLTFNALVLSAVPVKSGERMVLACLVDYLKKPMNQTTHAMFLNVQVD